MAHPDTRWVILPVAIIGKEASMATDREKRSSTRHAIQGVISLHTSLMTPDIINAHILNCSEEGICFTSTKQISTGTTIFYRLADESFVIKGDKEGCKMLSIGMVTVKWCQESSNHEHPVYIYGATYVPST